MKHIKTVCNNCKNKSTLDKSWSPGPGIASMCHKCKKGTVLIIETKETGGK